MHEGGYAGGAIIIQYEKYRFEDGIFIRVDSCSSHIGLKVTMRKFNDETLTVATDRKSDLTGCLNDQSFIQNSLNL